MEIKKEHIGGYVVFKSEVKYNTGFFLRTLQYPGTNFDVEAYGVFKIDYYRYDQSNDINYKVTFTPVEQFEDIMHNQDRYTTDFSRTMYEAAKLDLTSLQTGNNLNNLPEVKNNCRFLYFAENELYNALAIADQLNYWEFKNITDKDFLSLLKTMLDF